MVAICVRRANLSLMVQVVTVVRYATRDRSSLSNCSPPSYNKKIQKQWTDHTVYKAFIQKLPVNMQLKIGRCYRAKRKHPLLQAFLDSLINHCLRLFATCVSVMWCDVMRSALGATWWPSTAPHPAERALEDGLLHFNRYQAGHQAGECVVDDGREGRLVRRQRGDKKKKR